MSARLCILALLALLTPHGGGAQSPWRVTIADTRGTEVDVLMTLRMEGSTWELYSRPGGVNQFVSWPRRILGRIAGKLPPRGALIHARGNTARAGDSLILRGNLESQFLGRRFLKASVSGNQLRGELYAPSDTLASTDRVVGIAYTGPVPLRDYPAIAARARDTIRALVYDAAIAERPAMHEFLGRLAVGAARAVDDLDMMAAFAAAQPLIGISHFGFVRNPRIATTPLDSLVAGNPTVDVARFVNFSLYGDGSVAYLRVSSWDRATPFIQRAFERMDSARTEILVLDITSNGGGDATAMTPAAHLFRESVSAGVGVGRPWFAAHRNPPTPAVIAQFPLIDDEEKAKSLLKIVTTIGGAQLRVRPRTPHFAGKVYLLVDERTGSASETLAHLLKATGRATLVGRRTAGAMLTALPHPVGEGFVVVVPELDYYGPTGFRVEGNGVEPDVVANDPHTVTNEEIRKTNPYPALLMLGQVAYNRRQFDTAERYWREAMAIAPDDAHKQAVQRRIDQGRRAAGRPPIRP